MFFLSMEKLVFCCFLSKGRTAMNQSCVFFGLVLYQDGVTIVEEFLNPG